MAKYRVHGTLTYSFEVEADNEEDAIDQFFSLDCQERKQYCFDAEFEADKVATS